MGVGASDGSPFKDGVDACSARVDLERVGEHDKDNDGGFADGGADGGGVYG